MAKHRILIINDKEEDCKLLKSILEKEHYIVNVASEREHIKENEYFVYSLMLIDVYIGKDVVAHLAKYFRENSTGNPPIILCTARERGNIDAKLFSVEDYISRPYSVHEILTRIKTVLRREEQKKADKDMIVYDNIRLNLKNSTCYIDEIDVMLTKNEFNIFAFLLTHRGLIIARESIVSKVWPEKKTVLGRTVDVNITRLRKKIGRYGDQLITRSGYGYGFDEVFT